MSEHPPVPNLNLEREQAAFRELGETRISVSLARSVMWLFALTLAAVPLFELVRHPTGQPGVAEAFRELSSGPLDACAIQAAEDRIEERSQAGDRIRPLVQAALTREKVFDGSPNSKSSRRAIQDAFNEWVDDGGKSLTRVSKVLAFTIG